MGNGRKPLSPVPSTVKPHPETASLKRRIASMCWSGPLRPALMVLTDRWLAPSSSQAVADLAQSSGLPLATLTRPLYSYVSRVPASGPGVLPHLGQLLLTLAVGLELRKPAVGQAADAPHHPVCPSPEPNGDRALHRQGVNTGVGNLVVSAVK